MRKKIDPEVDEAMRQCAVVYKVAIQLGVAGVCGWTGQERVNVGEIGAEHFGLTSAQSHRAMGRAQAFLQEVREAECARDGAF